MANIGPPLGQTPENQEALESPAPETTTSEESAESLVEASVETAAEETPCEGEVCEQLFKAPRIFGTQGGLDYTVVARNGGIVMGLKLMPYQDFANDATRLGLVARLRTVFEAEVSERTDTEALGRELEAAFPGLEYEVIGSTPHGFRARTHLTFLTAKRVGQEALVVDAIRAGRFYGKLSAFVEQFVQEPAELTLDFETFQDALEEQVMAIFPIPEPEPIDAEPEDVSGESPIGIVRCTTATTVPIPVDDGADFGEFES